MEPINVSNILNEIVQYRGAIIQESINIEAIIDSIIINYFAKERKHSEFLVKVVGDAYFSFGLKINILEKLKFQSYPGFIEDIRRVNNIRNIFAHCLPGSFDGELSVYNKKKGIPELKHPEELRKEFIEKIRKVEKQLMEIFDKIINENKEQNGTTNTN